MQVRIQYQLVGSSKQWRIYGNGTFDTLDQAKIEVDKCIRAAWKEHGRENFITRLYTNFPADESEEIRAPRERNRDEWGGLGYEECKARYYSEQKDTWYGQPSGVPFVNHQAGNKEYGHRNVKWVVSYF